jgi:hypothetical protein
MAQLSHPAPASPRPHPFRWTGPDIDDSCISLDTDGFAADACASPSATLVPTHLSRHRRHCHTESVRLLPRMAAARRSVAGICNARGPAVIILRPRVAGTPPSLDRTARFILNDISFQKVHFS